MAYLLAALGAWSFGVAIYFEANTTTDHTAGFIFGVFIGALLFIASGILTLSKLIGEHKAIRPQRKTNR